MNYTFFYNSYQIYQPIRQCFGIFDNDFAKCTGKYTGIAKLPSTFRMERIRIKNYGNFLPIMSFSMAATTFVGQNFGAGKLDRVKKSLWVTLGMGVVYTILTGVLLLAFQDPIMHLFTHEEDVVAFGCTAMHYFCPFYWELSILHGLAGTVRGTGKTIPPMVVLLVSLCVFRIGWIQWVLPFFSSIDGIFLLYPVSWGLGALMMVGYAWKANWLEN